jgi:glutaredoxin
LKSLMRAAWLAVLLCCLFPVQTLADNQRPCQSVDFYWRQGCPHCQAAHEFLDHLKANNPDIEIRTINILASDENWQAFTRLNQQFGVARPGVPGFYLCGEWHIGYLDDETTGRLLMEKLGLQASTQGQGILLPWVGEVQVSELGLPLFTLTLGLIDGFNPCAMWVLLILLSILTNIGDRRKMALIALTFVLVSGLVYFMFMAAWLNLFLLIGWSRLLQVCVGLLALIIGAIHTRDFYAPGAGLSLSIPEQAKPALYARVRAVVTAKNLPASLLAVILVAILVNLTELLCTAGLPALYTQVLSGFGLPQWQYYAYLALYNLAYIVDDGLMVTLAVVGLSHRKLQASEGRWLKLLSGCVMLIIGLVMLLAPDLLHFGH